MYLEKINGPQDIKAFNEEQRKALAQEIRETKGQSERNLFKAMGLEYRFVEAGNDTEALIAAFSEVKDIDHPVVIHIVTQKGKGYKLAEENKEDWHFTGQDKELLERLKANHELVVTLEDGVLDGGFGEKIARFYSADKMKVLNFGLSKNFYDRYDYEALAKENHLTAAQIAEDILANL